MDVYEFGPFHLDVERLLLLHEGEPVALGPKVVETLLALVEHPGEVLAKAMLLDRIWPEGFVEEANLAQNIYVLRKMLRTRWGTDAIETVPRRGYRFTAPVHRIARAALAEAPVVAETASAIPAPAAIDIQHQPVPRFPSARWIMAAASALTVLAASFTLLASVMTHRANAGETLSDNGSRLYQIGRYYWNLRTREGVEKSLTYFTQVVDSDPKSARGYAAISDVYAVMGDYRFGSQTPQVYFARARGYAEKALSLDPNSAEAHAALGLIGLDQKNMPKAMTELQRAIALDPAYGPAREWYGIGLVSEGQLRDGFAQLKRAADLDPLSVSTTAWLGSAAYYDRRYHEAIAYSQQALELSPQRTDALTTMGEAYEAEGNITRAIEAYKQYATSDQYHRAEGAALLAHVYAISHRYPEARAELAYARAHARDVDPADLAVAAAALGDRSVAFSLLRRMHTHGTWMAIIHDARFDSLRNDTEFRQLAQESA